MSAVLCRYTLEHASSQLDRSVVHICCLSLSQFVGPFVSACVFLVLETLSKLSERQHPVFVYF